MKRLAPAFSPRFCLKLLLVTLLPLDAVAAQQPQDSIARIRRVFEQLAAVSQRAAVFPGFRPDTMAYAVVLLQRGVVLVNWRGSLPNGFESVPGLPGVGWQPVDALGAANTSTEMNGRAIAQLVADTLDMRGLLPLATHEAFHVFQTANRSEQTYLGDRENSFYVGTYPVFDTINDAQFMLESKLLEQALAAPTIEQARDFARQFAAVRAARHRRLGHALAEFEQKAEGNEGLAEYALLRTRNVLDQLAPAAVPTSLVSDLRGLTSNLVRSFRLRYYTTGSAQAFLLDRLDPAWKTTLLNERVFLDELVARASGARAAEQQALKAAEAREGFSTFITEAASNLTKLRARRLAQVDSILSRPGLQLVIDLAALPNRDIGWCGIDPQNLLLASRRVLLHMRWLRVCSGSALEAEFNTPTIQDRDAAELKAVVEPGLRITAGGAPVTLEDGMPIELRDVRMESNLFNARFSLAELRRSGNLLHIRPRM